MTVILPPPSLFGLPPTGTGTGLSRRSDPETCKVRERFSGSQTAESYTAALFPGLLVCQVKNSSWFHILNSSQTVLMQNQVLKFFCQPFMVLFRCCHIVFNGENYFFCHNTIFPSTLISILLGFAWNTLLLLFSIRLFSLSAILKLQNTCLAV